MNQTPTLQRFINQSQDSIWIVNQDFELIYANNKHLNIAKLLYKDKYKLNSSVFVEGLDHKTIEKWKALYNRGFEGEYFDIEEQFYNPDLNETRYGQTTFEPVLDDNQTIIGVACRWKDITFNVYNKSQSHLSISASLDVFCTFNEKGEFVYVSDAALTHWGYAPSELIGKPYVTLILEDDVPKTLETQDAIFNGKDLVAFNNRYKKKNGEIAYNSWSARWDEGSRLLFCVARDNKEVVEQEKQLLLSEQRFKALAHEGSDLTGILNAEGNYVYHSPTNNGALINHSEDLIGKKALNFIHPDDLERITKNFEQLSSQKRVHIKPFRQKNHDNEWRWKETILTNMLDHPAVNGIVMNSKDITDKIKQEEKIKQSEERFKALVQEGSDLIAILDKEGTFRYISPSCKTILGIEPEHFINKNTLNFIHPDDKQNVQSGLDNIGTKNKVIIEPFRFQNHDKEWHWMETVYTNMLDNPAVKGIIANYRDITEAKKLKELNDQVSEIAKIGYWEVDLVNNHVFWSDEVHKLHGTNPKTYIPNVESGINFYREDFRELVETKFNNSIATGNVFDFEAIIVTANKKELWVRSIGNTEIVDDECLRVYGSFQDISERKEAENRLEDLTNNLPGVTYEYVIYPDGTDNITAVSPGVKELLGFGVAEIMNDVNVIWKKIEAGGDLLKLQASLAKSIETKSKWTCEYKYVMPSGDVRTHLAYGMPRFLSDGTIIFNSVVLDITQEAKNEALLEQITNIARIGSWELDLLNNNDDAMYLSPMVKEILELNQNYKPTLTKCFEFYTGKNYELIKHAMHLLIKEGIPFDEEVLACTAKGNERWVRCIGKRELINNQPTRVYGSYQDIHKQKIASLELEESLKALKDYKFSLDQSAIIAFTDENGIIIYANDIFCKISKYEREELIGNTHKLINANYHPKSFFKDLWKTISSGNVWRGEVQNRAKDGSYYWVDTTIVPFLNDNNKPIKYLAIRFDITERKKAVAKLSYTSERLSLATTSAKMGIWDLDLNNNSLTWDDKMHELYGIDKKKFDGHYTSWPNGIHPDDLDKTTAAFEKALAGEKDFYAVFRVVWPDKSVHYIEAHGIVSRDETGKAVRIIGGNVDITKRKIDEDEKNYLQSTLENSLNEIYIFDEQTFKFSYANKGALLNLGYSQDEIKTLTPIDIKPEITQTSFRALIHPLVSHKKNKLIFFTNHQRKDGSLYPVEIHLQLISESYHKRFLAVVIDITERKKAEEAIVIALDEKNTILESIGDGFFTVDSNWIITYWNKEAELIMNKSKAQAVGKNLWEEYPDAIDTKFYRDYHRAMSKRESIVVIDYYSGLEAWLEASVYPAKDGGIAIYFRDITKRKEEEKEKNRLQEALENSLNEIYIFDADTYKFNYVNKGALKNLGYTKDVIETLTPFDVICDLTESSFNQMITPLKTNEKNKIIVFGDHKRKDGSIYPVEAHVQLVREGDTTRYLIVILDITERKKAEDEDKFKANLLSMISQAIVATDIDGTVNYWNKAAETIYGWSKEEAEGKNIIELIPSQSRKEEANEIMELLKKGQAWSGEFQVKNKKEKLFPIFSTNSPVYDEHDTLSGMIGISSDITEEVKNKELLKRHTLELERSNQDLEQFAFIASHDLQEPLRMIHSFMDLLKQKYGHKIDQKGHEYIYFAIDGAKRMRQIILDLLEFSRANKPEEDQHREKVALKTVLSDYNNLRKNLIITKRATISCNNMPTLFTYKAVIDQIFHCLLDNAIKFSKSDTPPIIEIITKEQKTEWEFAIRDNGIGINQQYYDKIFGIFQRLNGKDSYSGTGIGLAVTKRHVEFLGGRIWLESKMGEGTVFYFTIPK